MRIFNHKTLALAVASVSLMGTAHAAGLDRSGQDVTAFLQDGTYAEAVYTYIDADVAGHDNGVASGASAADAYVKGRPTGDVAEAYDFFRYGVKADINDRFSVGVLYDEPFGAAVQHEGSSNFITEANPLYSVGATKQLVQGVIDQVNANESLPSVYKRQITRPLERVNTPEDLQRTVAGFERTLLPQVPEAAQPLANQLISGLKGIAHGVPVMQQAVTENANQGTNVEIRTNNVTGLLGVKFGEKRNFQVYGGAAAQRLTGEVHLRGTAYQAASNYDARIKPDQAVGWVAGVAYSKPEIALKAALTYRSQIEHDSQISEKFPALAVAGRPTTTYRDFKVTLPESYNLDFQTGVNPTTLLTAKVRYVPWSKFTIEPPTYGDATALRNNGTPLPIVSYDKDQWQAEIGLGKKISDKLAVSGTVGYDSGAGNPTTTLGPIKGYYSVGLGAKYNFTPEWSVSVGGKYLRFGDASAQLPTKQIAGQFADNDGYIAGIKLAYHAK